jgi:hypothetical protein
MKHALYFLTGLLVLAAGCTAFTGLIWLGAWTFQAYPILQTIGLLMLGGLLMVIFASVVYDMGRSFWAR